MEIPWVVGEYIVERHGRDVIVISRKDWNVVRKVMKNHMEVFTNKELKALDITWSPILVRGGDDAVTVVAKRELARRNRSKKS